MHTRNDVLPGYISRNEFTDIEIYWDETLLITQRYYKCWFDVLNVFMYMM